MRTIGFITSEDHPQLVAEEQDVQAILKLQNIEILPVIWNDKNVSWNNFACFIFRSPWDYFKNLLDFEKFLDFAELENLKTYNSIATIRKNMDKHYLLELEQAGISICPSIFLKKDKPYDIRQLMQSQGWETAVIKPTISGTAFHTYKINLQEAAAFQETFDVLSKEHTFIVQPFFPEIETQGERSLLFFNKVFSHAIIKKPNQGDFRVQGEFGGTTEAFSPSANDLLFAEQILSCYGEDLLYARVDYLSVNNKPYLMELELFEPSLYLHTEQAKENFIKAIAATA